MQYATRWEQAWYDSHDELVELDRLVVVEADSPEEAQKRTGLVVEKFHKATDADLDEWEELVEDPLSDKDLAMLLSLIAADLREVGRKRKRDRETGRWPGDADDAFDVNRARAFRLMCMAGKLELARDAYEEESGSRVLSE